MTISERYQEILAKLEELQRLTQRLLGQADMLAALIDAGLGSLEVPEGAETAQEPSLSDAGDRESREPISAL